MKKNELRLLASEIARCSVLNPEGNYVSLPTRLKETQLDTLNKLLNPFNIAVDFNQVFKGNKLVLDQKVILYSRESL